MNFNEMNGLNSLNEPMQNDRVSPQEAQFIIDREKANDWLRLISEMKSYRSHNYDLEQRIREMQEKMNRENQILSKYIKTFWDYKLEEKPSYNRRNAFDTDDIIMPETNSYKLYKKIFNENQYPYTAKPWHKINMSIEVKEDGYVILSRKVIKIKTPEEIEATKKEKAKKLKAKNAPKKVISPNEESNEK